MLKFERVSIDYVVPEGRAKSVEDVTLELSPGQVTALIGESGSGKTTLTGAVMGMLAPNARLHEESRILFQGVDLLKLRSEELRKFRWRKASMVFQAAQSAFNPTLTLKEQLQDSALDHGVEPANLEELLRQVRLDPGRVLNAYPHQLSGGMRQRALLAMALTLDPELLILDEPTTALDLITQACIFDIFEEIQRQRGLTILFITHDLAAVSRLAQHVAVLYSGRLVETGPVNKEFSHPYTQALMGSVPRVDGTPPGGKRLQGQAPGVLHKPSGCVLHPRCPEAVQRCSQEIPELRGGVACHLR
jgi:peptide/nickel transport system ATP-binding protein